MAVIPIIPHTNKYQSVSGGLFKAGNDTNHKAMAVPSNNVATCAGFHFSMRRPTNKLLAKIIPENAAKVADM